MPSGEESSPEVTQPEGAEGPGTPPRLWGLAEIADALGQSRNTVRQWYRRGRLPPERQRLAMGPVWDDAVITPWMRTYFANAAGRDVRTNTKAWHNRGHGT